jgi:hypothetical protein
MIEGEAEDHAALPEEPLFSIAAIVEERGPLHVTSSIRFSWEEFQPLFDLVRRSLGRKGRGRRRHLGLIDQFFVFMLYLTSGFTGRLTSESTHLC